MYIRTIVPSRAPCASRRIEHSLTNLERVILAHRATVRLVTTAAVSLLARRRLLLVSSELQPVAIHAADVFRVFCRDECGRTAVTVSAQRSGCGSHADDAWRRAYGLGVESEGSSVDASCFVRVDELILVFVRALESIPFAICSSLVPPLVTRSVLSFAFGPLPSRIAVDRSQFEPEPTSKRL